jgi:hypothetical protein
LGDVASIVADLDVTLSRQAKIGSAGKSGKGWAREKLPIGVGAVDPRWVLANVLTTWARDVSGDKWRPVDFRTVAHRNPNARTVGPFHAVCLHESCAAMRLVVTNPAPPQAVQAAGYLLGTIPAIRRHPAVVELVDEIEDSIRLARRTGDRPSDRVYFGACYSETPDEDGRLITCVEEIWASPAATEVTCRVCATEWEIAERRAWLLKRAEDMLVTVPQASEYIGEIGHIKVTQASIRGYLHRKRLAYRAPVDAKRFRLGDLLTVLLDESEKAERRTA